LVKVESVAIVPDGYAVIIGQSHFIKTVEDLYEALASSGTALKFGIAFCESSGPALIRYDGNDQPLALKAVEIAKLIGAGHVFVVTLKDGFPINVLNRIKVVEEVATVFCATSNPVHVIVADLQGDRGVLGVVDGSSPKGVEGEADKEERRRLLRKIGYKR